MSEEEKKFVIKFTKLQNQYGVDETHHFFNETNWENALDDLKSMIEAIDSDVRQDYFDACFPIRTKQDWITLKSSGMDDRDISEYGRCLVCARYCMGWIGNLKNKGEIHPAMPQALAFVYAAYWHLGDDFLLGNIVENVLRHFGSPDKYSSDTSSGDAATDLGFEIWREMENVFRSHYITQGIMKSFASSSSKPEFRDFLSAVNQLLEECND